MSVSPYYRRTASISAARRSFTSDWRRARRYSRIAGWDDAISIGSRRDTRNCYNDSWNQTQSFPSVDDEENRVICDVLLYKARSHWPDSYGLSRAKPARLSWTSFRHIWPRWGETERILLETPLAGPYADAESLTADEETPQQTSASQKWSFFFF